MSRHTVFCLARVGSTQGRVIEGSCRRFSKGICDARFEEMAIGRFRVFQRRCEL